MADAGWYREAVAQCRHEFTTRVVGWVFVAGSASGCTYLNPAFGVASEDTTPATSSGSTAVATAMPTTGETTGEATDATTDETTGQEDGDTTVAMSDGSSTGPEPLTCADVVCGEHATCSEQGGEPVCVCDRGYVGDGQLCEAVCTPENCDGICHHDDASVCVYPETCAELRDAAPDTADGDATLYVDGEPEKPWLAHCINMLDEEETPREYLTLPKQGGMRNVGKYVNSSDIVVTTRYLKVRLNPATWRVDIGDASFAETNDKTVDHQGKPVTSAGYGVAMTCNMKTTQVQIDLQNTSFAVDDQFTIYCLGGFEANGGSVSMDPQVVTLTGGGFCGWYAPKVVMFECPYNPLSGAGGESLQLKYVGP